MNLIDIIFNITNRPQYQKLSVKELPSQGYFYLDDFKISIKKPNLETIEKYKNNITQNVILITEKIKNTVKENIALSEGYIFDDIKSIDILYIFFKIVEFYKDEPVKINYFNTDTNEVDNIHFTKDNFIYWDLKDIPAEYDNINKCFIKDNYKYTLPSIGIENSMLGYLMNNDIHEDTFTDFLGFVGNKNKLESEEITNLIKIFNEDIDKKEMDIVLNLIDTFTSIQKYNLKKDTQIIDMKRGVDLRDIWD